MSETSVTVVGNIGTDVIQRRVGAEGTPVVSFRVVSNARRRDRLTGEWVDGDRFSAKVSCWRRLAEHVFATLAKGDPVVVQGRLSVDEYEVNGERRFSTAIQAVSVGPDLARCRAELLRRSDEDAGAGAGSARPVDADVERGVAGLPVGASAGGVGEWAPVGVFDDLAATPDADAAIEEDPWGVALDAADGHRGDRDHDTADPAVTAA